jgi:hypothetical protein
MSFQTDRPPNPYYEHDYVPPRWMNLSDPASWEQGGGTFQNVEGHGGGGHGGGGHGGHGHGGWGGGGWGWGYDYGPPWPYYDEPDPNDPRWRHRMVGQTGTGMSALMVMGLIWLAYETLGKGLR